MRTIDSMFSTDKVDYKAASRQTQGLDVPPDLTQLAKDNRAQVQGGVISASTLAQAGASGSASKANSVAPAAMNTVALSSVGDVRIERSGNERWVRTSMTPEQLWPLLRAFWQERGFEIVKESAESETIEEFVGAHAFAPVVHKVASVSTSRRCSTPWTRSARLAMVSEGWMKTVAVARTGPLSMPSSGTRCTMTPV